MYFLFYLILLSVSKSCGISIKIYPHLGTPHSLHWLLSHQSESLSCLALSPSLPPLWAILSTAIRVILLISEVRSYYFSPQTLQGLLWRKKRVLGEVTSQGDQIMNSQLGRSWWVLMPQARNFFSERFVFALSQPCLSSCASRLTRFWNTSGNTPWKGY